MRKKTLRIIFIFFIPCLSLFMDQAEDLFLGASELMLWGNWEEALGQYERAAELSTGELKQRCTLKSLQLRYELGQYSFILGKAADLASVGLNQVIKRDAILVEIKTMVKLGLIDQALLLFSFYENLFNRDPVWLYASWVIYQSLDMSKEADRVGWMIREYFPKSPEALILTGVSINSIKPSFLLKKGKN